MTKLLRALSLLAAMAVLAGGSTVAQDTKPKKTDDKKTDKKDDKKADDKKKDDKKADKKEAPGSVEITKAKGGGFRYRIKGPDGKVVAMPLPQASWETKEDVIKALDDLKEILKTKPVDAKEEK